MTESALVYHTASGRETICLGKQLGTLLRGGDVIGLVGELGSGKTWFAKGLGCGLGVSSENVITSPSFALVNEYEGRHVFFHMDAYRLERREDFLGAGLDEYFYGEGVVALEWADRWPDLLPEESLWVEVLITGAESRRIHVAGHHGRAVELLKEMKDTKVDGRVATCDV